MATQSIVLAAELVERKSVMDINNRVVAIKESKQA
jgi:hypothetical protein